VTKWRKNSDAMSHFDTGETSCSLRNGDDRDKSPQHNPAQIRIAGGIWKMTLDPLASESKATNPQISFS